MLDAPDSWAQLLEREGIIAKFIPIDFGDAEHAFDNCLKVCMGGGVSTWVGAEVAGQGCRRCQRKRHGWLSQSLQTVVIASQLPPLFLSHTLLPPLLLSPGACWPQAIKAADKEQLHVDGITTFCEMAVPLVSRLSEALGLPGNTPAAVDAARDKVGGFWGGQGAPVVNQTGRELGVTHVAHSHTHTDNPRFSWLLLS